ncbi:MAG: 50S ribosomal protein L18 [bacterium]|nr:50S ribosomal protein L18 [bacterium]
MEASEKRIQTRTRKKAQIRRKIWGTADAPRVSVFRSTKHIYVQAIDDEQGVTLAASSSLDPKAGLKGKGGNASAAGLVGKALGELLKSKGVQSIVFDRNGYVYHGRVKSLAEGIRESGIQF